MSYCPQCKSEYEKRVSRCSRCDCELVETLQEEPENIKSENITMVLLCKVLTEAEAYLIKGLLEAEKIPVFIKPLEVVMYDGVYADSEGSWGKVFVLSEDIEKARTILNDYLSGEPGEEEKIEDTESDELLTDEDEEEEL